MCKLHPAGFFCVCREGAPGLLEQIVELSIVLRAHLGAVSEISSPPWPDTQALKIPPTDNQLQQAGDYYATQSKQKFVLVSAPGRGGGG